MLPLFVILSILDYVIIVTQNQASAQIFTGPISSAMGGSGRAGIEMVEAGVLNPALLGLTKQLEAGAFYKNGSIESERKLSQFGATIVDSGVDSFSPGAFTYLHTYAHSPTQNTLSADFLHLAFGKFVTKKLSVGGSVYRAEEKLERTNEKIQRWNGQVGLFYLITPDIGVAYVFDNVVRAKDIRREEQFLAQQQAFGLYYRYSKVGRFRADAVYSDQKWREQKWNWHLGYDLPMSDMLTFRLGTFWKNAEDQRGWSIGLGFDGPNLRFGYSFQKQEENGGGALHGVDIRVAF